LRINTYLAMNEQIVELLRLPHATTSDRYAAARIEELEAERVALRQACEAAEQTLRNLATAFIVSNDAIIIAKNEAANLRAALGKPEKTAKRSCRHAISNYQLDGDTGHVWCFACKPPRRVTQGETEEAS